MSLQSAALEAGCYSLSIQGVEAVTTAEPSLSTEMPLAVTESVFSLIVGGFDKPATVVALPRRSPSRMVGANARPVTDLPGAIAAALAR